MVHSHDQVCRCVVCTQAFCFGISCRNRIMKRYTAPLQCSINKKKTWLKQLHTHTLKTRERLRRNETCIYRILLIQNRTKPLIVTHTWQNNTFKQNYTSTHKWAIVIHRLFWILSCFLMWGFAMPFIWVLLLVWIEMFVCRYFVCWVEFDQLYFSYLLKSGYLWVHVLTCVTGRVDCFRCVCACQTQWWSTLCLTMYVYLCSCIILCVILLVSFMQLQGNFCVIHRQ